MLVRYFPNRDMEVLSRQLNQVFDELFTPSQQDAQWNPAVELKDAEDALILRVQLPGIDLKDIDVQVTKQAVVISREGRREEQAKNDRTLRSEFQYGQFRRVVSLPVAIENANAVADYKHGILTLTLPKVTEVRNRVVKLNLAELQQSNQENETSDVWADAPATTSENS